MQWKQKDGGFSLIELLVSICILSIIVVPLLNVFVTSSKVSQSAGRIQKATNLAQSISESVKADSLEDIAKQFHNIAGSRPFEFEKDFNLVHSYKIQGENEIQKAENVMEVKKQLSGTGEHTYLKILPKGGSGSWFLTEHKDENGTLVPAGFQENESGIYQFMIHNIKDGSHYYDAVITLDAGPYMEGGAREYNEFQMPELSMISSEDSAVFTAAGTEEEAADKFYQDHILEWERVEKLWHDYEEEKKKNPSAKVPKSSKFQQLSREQITFSICRKIEISLCEGKIVTEEGNKHVKAKVKVQYRYSCPNVEGCTSDYITRQTQQITTDLKRIYLYFNPLESGVYGGDHVVYQEDGSIDGLFKEEEKINLFLIGQNHNIPGYCLIVNSLGVNGQGVKTITANVTIDRNGLIYNGDSKNLILKESAKKRIYEMQVDIYKRNENFFGSIVKYSQKDLYVSFHSTKGE